MGPFSGIIKFIRPGMRTWGLWKCFFATKFQFSFYFSNKVVGAVGTGRGAGLGGGREEESGRQKFYDAVMRFPGKISKLYSYLG